MSRRAARPSTRQSGFDCYLRQIEDALDATGVQSAIICGISYGGLIAAAFAARYPERALRRGGRLSHPAILDTRCARQVPDARAATALPAFSASTLCGCSGKWWLPKKGVRRRSRLRSTRRRRRQVQVLAGPHGATSSAVGREHSRSGADSGACASAHHYRCRPNSIASCRCR